jgi:hypothetical protein
VRSIVADSGPLVALFSRNDKDHERVREFLRGTPCVLLTTWLVATEVWHLLPSPARLTFAKWVLGSGVAVLELTPEDKPRMLVLMEKYRDRPMDLADASLVVLADRLGIREILTIDRADFDAYRLSGGKAFVQVL